MKTRLSQLGASEASVLDRLRSATTERGTLLALIHTSCLLELSKLGSAGIDLGTFARTIVDVLTQFFPLEGCLVGLAPHGLPSVTASSGDVGDDLGIVSHALSIGNHDSGVLAVRATAAMADDLPFFALAAQQISSSLGAIVERERLRRAAASATAMRLASSLEEGSGGETLEALADALAAVGQATGAVIYVTHRLFGPPLEIEAGMRSSHRTVHTIETPAGSLRFETHWTMEPGESELEVVEHVTAAAAVAVGRWWDAGQLREQVEVDPLTGVGNRRRATRLLNAGIARAERAGEPLSVLVLDLDHFKKVNDDLGHAAGDALLQAFAGLLGLHVRAYDTVARTGGDEFLLICPAVDAVGGRALAERLRRATPQACRGALPAEWSPQTVSIGVAAYPDVASYSDGLVRKADGALYEAKRSGRDRVVVALLGSDAGRGAEVSVPRQRRDDPEGAW